MTLLYHGTHNLAIVLNEGMLKSPFLQMPSRTIDNTLMRRIHERAEQKIGRYLSEKKKMKDGMKDTDNDNAYNADLKETERSCFVWFHKEITMAWQKAKAEPLSPTKGINAILTCDVDNYYTPFMGEARHLRNPSLCARMAIVPHEVNLAKHLRQVIVVEKENRERIRDLLASMPVYGSVAVLGR
jgi:hypothetical protein